MLVSRIGSTAAIALLLLTFEINGCGYGPTVGRKISRDKGSRFLTYKTSADTSSASGLAVEVPEECELKLEKSPPEWELYSYESGDRDDVDLRINGVDKQNELVTQLEPCNKEYR